MPELSAQIYDLIYSKKDYAAEADRICDFARMLCRTSHTPLNFLDVACGTGRHISALRHHIVHPEGLDISSGQLAIAKERNPGVTFHLGDMRSFSLSSQFDVVTCLFSSIGYIEDTEELNQAISCMARHLTPGGVLMVERWLLPERFENGHLSADGAISDCLAVARTVRSWREGSRSVLNMTYLVQPLGQNAFMYNETHHLTLFTAEEYKNAFTVSGLEDVYVDVAGLTGRGLVVGTKPF